MRRCSSRLRTTTTFTASSGMTGQVPPCRADRRWMISIATFKRPSLGRMRAACRRLLMISFLCCSPSRRRFICISLHHSAARLATAVAAALAQSLLWPFRASSLSILHISHFLTGARILARFTVSFTLLSIFIAERYIVAAQPACLTFRYSQYFTSERRFCTLRV